MMCDAFGEPVQAWSEKWRKARKEHWCCACEETIRPGDRYHYSSGVFDNSGFSYKHCARCWTIYKALVGYFHDLGDYETCVDLELNCGEIWRYPPPEVAALAFALPGDPVLQEVQ